MKHTVFVLLALLCACTPSVPAAGPPAVSLAGNWQLQMRDDALSREGPVHAVLALVDVQHDAAAPTDGSLVAAGAISLQGGAMARHLPDGTPVQVHRSGSDTITFDLGSPRDEYHVVLSGVLVRDSLTGQWRVMVGRSGGAGGAFLMTRRR